MYSAIILLSLYIHIRTTELTALKDLQTILMRAISLIRLVRILRALKLLLSCA